MKKPAKKKPTKRKPQPDFSQTALSVVEKAIGGKLAVTTPRAELVKAQPHKKPSKPGKKK